jgi:hypothetical protein
MLALTTPTHPAGKYIFSIRTRMVRPTDRHTIHHHVQRRILEPAGYHRGKEKGKVAKIDQNVGSVLYPKGPKGYISEGASYEDFVDVFSKRVWKNPDEAAIESAFRIVFSNHQTKYGKEIIPDEKQTKLLQKAESLPVQWTFQATNPFVINVWS